MFGEIELVILNSQGDDLGEFEGAVGVEMGVVGEGFGVGGKSFGGVMDEGFGAAVGAEFFEEIGCFGVEVDEGNVLFLGEIAHPLGEFAEAVTNFSIGIKLAARHGSDEDGGRLMLAGFINVLLEEGFPFRGIKRLVFHVVGAELDEKVVARLDGFVDLSEAFFLDEGLSGAAGGGAVGDGNFARFEEYGKHLAPTDEGDVVLIADGGIAGEINGDRLRVRCDVEFHQRGILAHEFQIEPAIHIEPAVMFGRGDFAVADVDGKCFLHGTAGWGMDVEEHRPVAFGFDGGDGVAACAAKGDSDIIVSVGKVDVKAEVFGSGDGGVEPDEGGGIDEPEAVVGVVKAGGAHDRPIAVGTPFKGEVHRGFAGGVEEAAEGAGGGEREAGGGGEDGCECPFHGAVHVNS